jgi:hypothetical protein
MQFSVSLGKMKINFAKIESEMEMSVLLAMRIIKFIFHLDLFGGLINHYFN